MARRIPGVFLDGAAWRAVAYDPVTKKKVRVKNAVSGKTAFASQDEAAAGKAAFEREKLQPASRSYTVDEWVVEWTTNPGYQRDQATTNAHNHERVRKFGDDFRGVPLAGIDRPAARRWAMANRGRSAAVRAMLNDAVADQVMPLNPFANLRLPKSKGRKDIYPLMVDEMDGLVGCADMLYPDWPVMSAFIETAAFAGLRIGELCGLGWQDVDWEQGVIHVRQQYRHRTQDFAVPKSGLRREVVMLERVAQSLRDLPRLNANGFVFYGRRDHKMYTPPSHNYFWTPIRTMFWGGLPKARQQQIPVGFDFHELRHFCGSYLADIGVSPQDIATQLGHTDGGKLAQELYVHSYRENAFARIRKADKGAHGGIRRAG